MLAAWSQHLRDPEEKARYETSIKHSSWVLDQLNTMLDKVESGLDRQERTPSSYDSPNWDYRQAHANGYRQCLHMIKSLINLDQKDTNERSTSERPI